VKLYFSKVMKLQKHSIFKFDSNNLKFFKNKNKLYFYIFNKDKFVIIKFNNFLLKNSELEFFCFVKVKDNFISSYFQNVFKGVMCGYKKTLEIKGIGYKFEFIRNLLGIDTGLSHTIFIKKPRSINFTIKKNKLKIFGFDLNQVSQMAARIKLFKKLDPYKGKGVKYLGEIILLKQGKKKKR